MMNDPIADMLARIKNAQQVEKADVSFPNSRIKRAILDVLLSEGYIVGYSEIDNKRNIVMTIKYYTGEPVIERLIRKSRCGLRYYAAAKDLSLVRNGLGVAVVSTSRGVMSDHQARQLKLGGEVLCEVY